MPQNQAVTEIASLRAWNDVKKFRFQVESIKLRIGRGDADDSRCRRRKCVKTCIIEGCLSVGKSWQSLLSVVLFR